MKLILKYLAAFLLLFNAVNFAQNNVVKIWNGMAPGTEGKTNEEKIENNRIKNVYQPDLTIYLPTDNKEKSSAVLIFPGGGYTHLAFEKEGTKIAGWFNKNGIAAFVLKYRLNPDEALTDAQRALSYVRYHSNKLNIDPSKIGVLGFSAGGHLAANLISHTKRENLRDGIDSVSCMPDFAVLVYGWLQDQFQYVSKNNPPTFLVHASDDTRVPVEQSINYYNMLLKNNVPAEMHIYEQGKHGFAMEMERGNAANWGRLCLEWMKERNIIK